MQPISLIAPYYRIQPLAQEFADYLLENVPHIAGFFHDAKGYAWETDIPPKAEWDRHAEEFAAHLVQMLEDEEDYNEATHDD